MRSLTKEQRHTIWMMLSIAAALVFAIGLPHVTRWGAANAEQAQSRAHLTLVPLKIGGEIFLRLLKMIVVPLVVTSVMSGVLGMGDVRKLGKPGLATTVYFLSCTTIAVFLGLLLVNLINPGGRDRRAADVNAVPPKTVLYETLARESGLSDEQVARVLKDDQYIENKHPTLGRIVENLALMMFTDNLLKSAMNMDLLPLITFSIVFAGLLTTLGKAVSTLSSFITQANEALMAFVLLVMKFAPLGIFCLVAARFGQANIAGGLWDELRKTGAYSITIILGLAIHGLIILPIILYAFTKRNPYRFYLQMSQALLTAFSTASSNATLPINIECAVERAKIDRRSVEFVMPLGATVNMDGTALYEAVAAVYISQMIGQHLDFSQQMIVAFTSALAAIGAAGIPEAGLVTMVIVLTAVGLPTEQMAVILSVDWLLDRFRTTVNVLGDSIGAAVVEKTFPPAPQTTPAI